MVDWTNLGGALGGIFDQMNAMDIASAAAESEITGIHMAGQVASQGALLSAEGYRQSAKAIPGALTFNLGIDRMNTQRQLEAYGRQSQRVMSEQLGQLAGTGVSIGSKSALALRNEVIDVFGTKMLHTQIDAENTRRAKIWEAQNQMINLENQARMSEYQSAVAQWQASVDAENARYRAEVAEYQSEKQMWSQMPTLFSMTFQDMGDGE